MLKVMHKDSQNGNHNEAIIPKQTKTSVVGIGKDMEKVEFLRIPQSKNLNGITTVANSSSSNTKHPELLYDAEISFLGIHLEELKARN